MPRWMWAYACPKQVFFCIENSRVCFPQEAIPPPPPPPPPNLIIKRIGIALILFDIIYSSGDQFQSIGFLKCHLGTSFTKLYSSFPCFAHVSLPPPHTFGKFSPPLMYAYTQHTSINTCNCLIDLESYRWRYWYQLTYMVPLVQNHRSIDT